MKRTLKALFLLVVIAITARSLTGQQSQPAAPTASVEKSSVAVGYQVDGGATKVDLKGTDVMPGAKGEAKVEAKTGLTHIEVKVEGLDQPGKLSSQFLTYILWAISPEGRASNLGEILLNEDGKGETKVTTQLQTFSLLVTSEPYFAVRQPSEFVVLENQPKKDTKGKLFTVDKYQLLKRSQYEKLDNPLALTLDTKNVPLQMYQARNSVEIAKSKGAEKYAPEIYSKAEGSLKIAEGLLQQKNVDKKQVVSVARQTAQYSEDARTLAAERQEQERVAKEQEAAAAKAKADAETKAAADAAAAARRAEEETRRQAEQAAANEARLKAQAKAEADALQAEANALQAKEAAARAETERVRKAAEAERAQLLEQLNRVLDTKDTPRGLVVNMADVLFDTGKYELRPEAREKLSRLSGILATHPDLHLEVEGYTDNTGGQELNQTLSEQRAQAVAGYLVDQGVPRTNVKATGLGPSQPVADNSTTEGRQKNRRVEIIVSGEEIGKTASK